MIATDNVALTTQHHRLGFVLDLLAALGHGQRNERVRIVEHQLTNDGVGALTGAEDIKQVPRRELSHGLGADHAAVGDDADAADREAPTQPLDHRHQRLHVPEHCRMQLLSTG